MVDHQPLPRRVEPGDPLETLLTDIWEGCLGRRPDDMRATFAALGATPSLAARMIAHVEQAVGTRLDPGWIPLDVTIEALAVLVKRQASGPAHPGDRAYFVRNAAGSAPPLFFLHGDFNGGGLYCITLARLLGSDQPLYAMAPLGVDGASVPPTIEAMATRHLETVRALRPQGPYRLGGHCAGAVIAFEMAHQLSRAGQTVDRLVLVAPLLRSTQFGRLTHLTSGRGWLLAPLRMAARTRDVAARARRLLKKPLAVQIAVAKAKLFRVLSAKASGPEGARRHGDTDAAPRRDDLWHAYGDAMWDYGPRSYGGRVTIIWPSEEPFATGERTATSWRRVAKRAAVRLVPGTHLGCITTHVAVLAEQLRTDLGPDRAAGQRAAGP